MIYIRSITSTLYHKNWTIKGIFRALQLLYWFTLHPRPPLLTHLADAYCDHSLVLVSSFTTKLLISTTHSLLKHALLQSVGGSQNDGCWEKVSLLCHPLTLTEGDINLSLIPSNVKGSLWCQPKGEDGPGQRYWMRGGQREEGWEEKVPPHHTLPPPPTSTLRADTPGRPTRWQQQ